MDAIDLTTEGGRFPKGMRGSGESVSPYPANTLRDLFFANDGRIRKDRMANAVGRYTFTYGQSVKDAWVRLVAEDYVVDDGDTWVWPMALPR